jgi:hypothetical protein
MLLAWKVVIEGWGIVNKQVFEKIASNVKSFAGSIVIGLSIIVGLNFQWFITNFNDFYDEISGKNQRETDWALKRIEDSKREFGERQEYKKLWESFLKDNFNGLQFKVVKSETGDYFCYDPSKAYPEPKARSDKKGEVIYEGIWPKTITEINDEMVDKFLDFLSARKYLGKNWVYDDIDSPNYQHIFLKSDLYRCKAVKDVYRRNRFKQRLDIEIPNR